MGSGELEIEDGGEGVKDEGRPVRLPITAGTGLSYRKVGGVIRVLRRTRLAVQKRFYLVQGGG